MVDMSLISGAVGSLKSAADIAKTVKDADDLHFVRGRVIEMQDLILGAQSAAVVAQSQLLEMMQEIGELKAKLAGAEEWKTMAARYALRDFGDNTLAYELRPEMADGEPHHLICPTCYQQQRRSILQFNYQTTEQQKKYHCRPCGVDINLGTRHPSPSPRINRRPSSGWDV